jgi:hypothetical protein
VADQTELSFSILLSAVGYGIPCIQTRGVHSDELMALLTVVGKEQTTLKLTSRDSWRRISSFVTPKIPWGGTSL